uniref:Uncharacterized protein n=2 Tax=Lutzomyia longipalpis TaxID=7200 RepID=A0A1B0CHX8_LUTLO
MNITSAVSSYYITEAEGRLLNEINHKHSESHFGREMFTVKDLVVRLSDVSKFWTFLDVCYKKLLMGNNGQGQSEKCGFIRINKESVVPYTVRDGQKFVPLFYFEGETENLKLKADNLSGWDLSYLKFCCKVQGIRNELFASDKVAVISLTDIKSYFPPGTQFEDYWPNKVVDTQLLVQKSNANSSVHWTRQPTAPPPKPTSSTQSKAAPTRKQATAVSYGNAAMSQVNMQQRLPGQMGSTNTPVVSNVWSNLTSVSGLNLTPGQQEHQAQSQRAYPTTRSQVQNIMQRQPYNVNFPPVAAAAAAMSAMTGLSSSSNQVPPPLIRGAQQAPTSHHMSSCVTGPPSLRSSNSLTINPVATPSHLLPPPPPYSASSNHLHEYLLANVSLASSPKNNHYASGGSNKTTYSTSNYNNNNSDYLLNNNILNAIYSKTAVTSIANHPVGSPARASPNQSHSVSSSGQPKQPPPPLIPMPNTSASDAFSAIRDTLQQLRSLKSLTTTFLPQNIPIPDPYGSPSPSSHAAGTTSPFSLHPLSMVPAAQSPVDIKPQPPTFSPSLANRQTKSVTMSATDVIDLSSPPRSAASLLHHQQQQQQQHHHQQHHQQQQQLQQQQQILQQQRGQQILTNGRCNTNAQNLMHGAPSAASAAAQVAAMQQHQRQSSVDASRLSAIPEMVSHNGNVPYKMQKAQIDGCTVPCINMKAYTYTDLLMTLADLKDIFFPHMTLENCRKVLDVLNESIEGVPGVWASWHGEYGPGTGAGYHQFHATAQVHGTESDTGAACTQAGEDQLGNGVGDANGSSSSGSSGVTGAGSNRTASEGGESTWRNILSDFSTQYPSVRTSLALETAEKAHNLAQLAQFPSPPVPPSNYHHHHHHHDGGKKLYSACRYQNDKLDYYSPSALAVAAGYNAMSYGNTETVATSVNRNSSYIPPPSPFSTLNEHHHQQMQQHQQSAIYAAAVAAAASHFPTGASSGASGGGAAGSANAAGSNSYHLQVPNVAGSVHDTGAARSCALPSPTIYPPTPPPSAPWVHPWFVEIQK